MNQSLLSVKELSSFLRVHPNTVYKTIRNGKIHFYKIPGVGIRFKREDIAAWVGCHSIKKIDFAGVLPKFDLSLITYDKMFLKWRTELKGQTTRFTYGIGSVILRKTKNKEDRFYIDYQVKGRRVRHAVKGARTRAEAVMALNSEIADELRGRYNFKKENPELNFSDMAELYLEKYAKKKKKKSWKTSDWVYLRRLRPYFGNYKLTEIDPQMIEDYITERLETGIKECSVNREISCLRRIFNIAIDWNYTSFNPCSKVKLFNEKENIRERVLTQDEEIRFFDASSLHLRPMLLVALYTGMRKGEIFKLQWRHVDFEKKEIRIPESKSGKERRIPINSDLFETLSGLRPGNGSANFVFINPDTGKAYVDVKRAFNGACRRAGIDELRFHDLRHTFASRLVKRGVDLVIVKELMGHASIVTTQRYLHSQAEEKMRAVEKLTQNFQKPGPECQMGVKSDVDPKGNKYVIHSFSTN